MSQEVKGEMIKEVRKILNKHIYYHTEEYGDSGKVQVQDFDLEGAAQEIHQLYTKPDEGRLLTRAEILKVHKAKDGFPLDPGRDFYKRLNEAQDVKTATYFQVKPDRPELREKLFQVIREADYKELPEIEWEYSLADQILALIGFCPECGKYKPDDDRVKAGMKCTECTYGGDNGRYEGVASEQS